MGKKLISISMVRNENDVIESFVRHNLELMDEMHIIDHGSSDGTREILIQLKEEGLPVFIYQYQALKYNQEQLVNLLMKQLVAKDEAIDFVFPLDADEF
ncbi:glycosyltransferase family 2 protein, partial [Neisseria sp. P0021.S005]